ncbi:MAG: pilin [Bacteroidota bacterium]
MEKYTPTPQPENQPEWYRQNATENDPASGETLKLLQSFVKENLETFQRLEANKKAGTWTTQDQQDFDALSEKFLQYLDGQELSTNPAAGFSTLTDPQNNPGGPTNGETSIQDLMGKTIDYAMGIVAILAMMMIIIGGMQLITANGDPDVVQKGKKQIASTIMGLVIILSAYTIVNTLLPTMSTSGDMIDLSAGE